MKTTVSLLLSLFITCSVLAAVPVARFADPERAKKLAAALPQIDKAFDKYVSARHHPGAAMAILIDGEIVWSRNAGHETVGGAPVTNDSRFRIASMTKSFTAMAILKLRDEGKLSLDDPAAKYVPELAALVYPTTDSPRITIRDLLTHAEGFPEDNPWGDRQMAIPDKVMGEWMKAGIPFSTAPGTAFEYSNYGFAILGRIVANVSGKPYSEYIRTHILLPLGMRNSGFDIPSEHKVQGYRWEDGTWKAEPILGDGSFGPMGGIWTTVPDLARYVAFYMSAVPARDGAETGPIKRSSAREMQQLHRTYPGRAYRPAVDAPLELFAGGYGFGLGVSSDCRVAYSVGHGGGFPGYGSLMQWLPEHGVGMIGMASLTYAGWRTLFNEATAALDATGALQPRVQQPAPALLAMKADVSTLVNRWDDALATRIVADNFFLDQSAERRAKALRELNEKHGACVAEEKLDAENALRGRWKMNCERGWLDVWITLAPTTKPTAQFLFVRGTMPPSERMLKTLGEVLAGKAAVDEKGKRQLAALNLNWGNCKPGKTLGGDGKNEASIELTCDRGNAVARMTLGEDGALKTLDLVPSDEKRCVP
jgi:CubicO group peptidase (beta-lactamase class C family)